MTIDDTTKAIPDTASAANLLSRSFGWGELFLLVPLHIFWVLYKSTPFVAENPASAAVAAVPLGVAIIVGLAACLPRVRAVLVNIERLLHFTAAACMALVLLYVATRDPFVPLLPITWPLCFWSVALSFVTVADVAMHARLQTGRQTMPGHSWTGWGRAVGIGFVTWIGLVWLASGMDWLPYFLTFSAAFHAVMVLLGGNTRNIATSSLAPPQRFSRLASLSTVLETCFAMALLLGTLLRFAFFNSYLSGTAELKYFQLANLAATPWFVFGAILAILSIRFRATFLTHAIAVGILIFFGHPPMLDSASSVSFLLGYSSGALFFTSTQLKAFAYAISAAASTVIWIFGAFALMVAGVVIVYDMGAEFAFSLIIKDRIATIVLFILWLTVTAIHVYWPKCNADTSPSATDHKQPSEAKISGWARYLTYAATWLLVLVPVGYLAATTMWPPVWFEQASQIKVGEPTGVCHAGGSRSDEEYASLDKLGVKLIRTDFHWNRIQPDANTWKLDHFDAYLDAADKHDTKILALVLYDNNAVETSPKGKEEGRYIAPEDVPLFLEYVRRTVEHYKDRVYAWEIWNEPDIARFWTGTPEEFYDLARRTAKTIREVHPKARILGPAMTAPLGAMSAKQIEGLHTAGAMKNVDHPTMHTYLSDPRGYYNEFLRTQNAAAKHGHDGSVWITELGDPDGGVYPWRASSELLAEHAIKSHVIATSLGIEKLIWYCYHDSGNDRQRNESDNSEGFFGLLGPKGQWKPAAHAYSVFAKNCSNSTIRRDLVKLSGGLAARQLRSVLYRRDNGDSTLILWFEPTLRPDAHARVTLNLGQLEQPAVVHDITSDYTKELLDDFVNVTEKPLVITFQSPDLDTPVTLRASSSPADAMWLLAVFALVLWSGISLVRTASNKKT